MVCRKLSALYVLTLLILFVALNWQEYHLFWWKKEPFFKNSLFLFFVQLVSFMGASRVILATENDYCKLCDASFSSPAVAQAHYQGKNHAKRLRLAEAQQSSSIMWVGVSTASPPTTRKTNNRCNVHMAIKPTILNTEILPLQPCPLIWNAIQIMFQCFHLKKNAIAFERCIPLCCPS